MIDIELLGVPALLVEVVGSSVRYVAINAALQELLDVRPHDIVGKTPLEVWPSERGERADGHFRRCLSGGEIVMDKTSWTVGDALRHFSFAMTPLRSAGSADISHIVVTCQDITESVLERQKLKEGAARLELALEVLDGAFWHLDVGSGAFTASNGLARMADAHPGEAFGGPEWMALVEHDDETAAGLEPLLEGEKTDLVTYYRIRTLAGAERWMKCRRKAIRDDDGAVVAVCGVTVDITSEKSREAEWEAQAARDPLTGLRNTRVFHERLRHYVSEASNGGPTRLCVVVADLDDFKPINDTFGHAAGDAVLKAFSNKLRSAFRREDWICRVGGDEFAVILPGATGVNASELIGRFMDELDGEVTVEGQSLRISASFGHAEWQDGWTNEELLRVADLEMYRAKRRKKRAADSGAHLRMVG